MQCVRKKVEQNQFEEKSSYFNQYSRQLNKLERKSQPNVTEHDQIIVIRLSNVIEFQWNGQFLGNTFDCVLLRSKNVVDWFD